MLSTQHSSPGTSTLRHWISHRAGIVGLSWPEGVADASGVSSSLLTSIGATGNLRRIGRSARGYIARALQVSVRELEALADGRIDWIDDRRIVAMDRLSPGVARTPTQWPAQNAPIAYPSSHGVPILGRILENGKVENSEDWTAEDGRRLAVRFVGLPDAFSLELNCDVTPYRAGAVLVFQPVAPGELLDGELAVITPGSSDAETILCTIRHEAEMSVQLFSATVEARKSSVIAMGEILRAARGIGSYGG